MEANRGVINGVGRLRTGLDLACEGRCYRHEGLVGVKLCLWNLFKYTLQSAQMLQSSHFLQGRKKLKPLFVILLEPRAESVAVMNMRLVCYFRI